MAIAVIYHHHERGRAEEFCRPLQAEGVELELAPIGLEVGTQEWRNAVQSQLVHADGFLCFLTKKSVLDDMVAWRIGVALSTGKQFIPITLDEDLDEDVDPEKMGAPETDLELSAWIGLRQQGIPHLATAA